MSDKDDKTEKPTGKKVHEARQKGQIARSADLVAWASIFVGISVLKSTVVKGGRFMQQMMNDMGELIVDHDQGKALKFLTESIAGSLKLIAPLVLTFMVVAIIGHFAQVRFVLAFKSIQPKFSKLNPITGSKNLFSKQSLFMAAKQLVKLVILSYIAYRTMWTTTIHLAGNGPYSIDTIITVTSGAVMDFVKEAAIAGIVIGLVDYFYQRKKTADGMKMSKADVKQESRSQESSPEIKGKIRQKQRQMSRNRMMAAVKDADVVIVNPVHVAVALTYDAQKGAPRVVAKGAGFVAEKIREKAEENNVMLVQDVPLARTLHHVCDIDDEIPAEMFEAVALLLAFVFSLKSLGRGSGFHKMPGTPDVAEYEAQEAERKAEERFKPRPQDASVGV